MARKATDIIITKNLKKIKFTTFGFTRAPKEYKGKTFTPAYFIKLRTNEGKDLYKKYIKSGLNSLDMDYPINLDSINILKENVGEVSISFVSFNS